MSAWCGRRNAAREGVSPSTKCVNVPITSSVTSLVPLNIQYSLAHLVVNHNSKVASQNLRSAQG